MMRLIARLPSKSALRRVSAVMLQPTGQYAQIVGTGSISQGRAPKRKSAVVSAPTGQMSVVLPLKIVSKGGSLTVSITRSRPRLWKPSTGSPTTSSQ